ncbi:MAG TPA: APC family permease [Symbiobacteriaceae bacterium]|jgi:amino acid transporter
MSQPSLQKTLNLTGVTVNAMALIAPGAFLWLTFQLQAAQTDVAGASTALDTFAGVALALVLAFLTAASYAQLAELYPEAGTGSSYYFAERAFLDRQEGSLQKFARLAKFSAGWLSHLYYWVYPGVMVAMLATLVAYICGQFGLDLSVPAQVAIAVGASLLTGYIAFRGVNGSTSSALVINVIQIVTLVAVTVLAISYRVLNPDHVTFIHTSALDVIRPHSFTGVIFQSTIAILLMVGFESATALAAEATSIKHVSRGVLLSLVIQGLLFYLFEYFGAGFFMNGEGYDAAAKSSAPIGDMVKVLGDSLLGGTGFVLMIIVAASVAIAVFGSALACMNTGVRVTYAMGRDGEVPTVLGALHGRFATPHYGVLLMAVISAVIGGFGVMSLRNLTAVTLLSNIGTFLIYGLTNLVAFVAFVGTKGFKVLKHGILPLTGVVVNVAMLLAVFYLGFAGGGDSRLAALLAIGGAGLWVVGGIVYLVANSARLGRPIFSRT